MESRYFIKPGQPKALGKSTTSWILRVIVSPLKTSNAVLEFVVPFSITPVFLLQFLKIGKALSQQVTRQLPTREASLATNESLEPSQTPLAEAFLKEQKLNPGAVYELPFKITIENKLRSFQFMLIHNIIPTNQRLWQMNIKTSPQCEKYNFPTETTIHKFYECPAVKLFWKDVLNWWNFKRSDDINPSATEFLYGYKPESTCFHAFNHYLLIARY